jgi:hypothetical protein
MPVVLTGDVHHRIPSSDRRHANESECALAVEYARIAARHGLKATLYVTGRALREDRADALPLPSLDNVELAGHGWDAFHPHWLYRPMARIASSPHGLRVWQRRGIRRTCAEVEEFAGKPVRAWRNHAYLHDRHTADLLAEAGLTSWSDHVDPSLTHPYVHGSGLVVLPLNTTPDHENLYHGDRTPETVGEPRSLHPDEWVARVVQQAESLVAEGGTATVLAHPLCMKVTDDWKTFDALCSALAAQDSQFATEAAALALSSA